MYYIYRNKILVVTIYDRISIVHFISKIIIIVSILFFSCGKTSLIDSISFVINKKDPLLFNREFKGSHWYGKIVETLYWSLTLQTKKLSLLSTRI